MTFAEKILKKLNDGDTTGALAAAQEQVYQENYKIAVGSSAAKIRAALKRYQKAAIKNRGDKIDGALMEIDEAFYMSDGYSIVELYKRPEGLDLSLDTHDIVRCNARTARMQKMLPEYITRREYLETRSLCREEIANIRTKSVTEDKHIAFTAPESWDYDTRFLATIIDILGGSNIEIAEHTGWIFLENQHGRAVLLGCKVRDAERKTA